MHVANREKEAAVKQQGKGEQDPGWFVVRSGQPQAPGTGKGRVSSSQTRQPGAESSLSQQHPSLHQGGMDPLGLPEAVSPQKHRQQIRDRSGPTANSLSKNRTNNNGAKGTSNAQNQPQTNSGLAGDDPLRRKTLHNFNTRSSKTLGQGTQPGIHHATSATAMQQNSNYQLKNTNQQSQERGTATRPRRQLTTAQAALPVEKSQSMESIDKKDDNDSNDGQSPYQRGSTYAMPQSSYHYNGSVMQISGNQQQPQYLTQYGQKFSKSQKRKTSHNLNSSAGEGALAVIYQQNSATGPVQPDRVVSGGGTITLKNQSLSANRSLGKQNFKFQNQQQQSVVAGVQQPQQFSSSYANNGGYQYQERVTSSSGLQQSNGVQNKNLARLALTQNNFYNARGTGFQGSQNLMRINETVTNGADSDSGIVQGNTHERCPDSRRGTRKSRKATAYAQDNLGVDSDQRIMGGPSPYENVRDMPASAGGQGGGIFQSKTGRNTFYVSDNNRQKHSLLKELNQTSKPAVARQLGAPGGGHSATRQGQRVIWGGPGAALQSQQSNHNNNPMSQAITQFTKPRALSRQADAQIRIEVHRDTKIRNYMQAAPQDGMTLMFYDFNGSSKQGAQPGRVHTASNTAQNFYKQPITGNDAADEYVAQQPMMGFRRGMGPDNNQLMQRS